jgi:FAD binding domain/Aromatic-ring hydroxylase, C-terminal
VIGAEGARSVTRDGVGIAMTEPAGTLTAVRALFRAPLWDVLGDRRFGVYFTSHPDGAGTFLPAGGDRWVFGVIVGADPAERAHLTPTELERRLRAGSGVPDLDVTVERTASFASAAQLADRFRRGRVFLAGDAAHLMPPNGGFGGNTGIHDAHNLAWKLAMVLQGDAGPALLDTYEAERKPVGKFTVEQAYTRYVTRTAPYLGAKDFEAQANDFNIELGYLYRSPAIVAEDQDEKVHDDPHKTCGRPGARAPHVWLQRDGKRLSTIDLSGTSFVLLAGPEGEAWCRAARSASEHLRGIKLESHCVGGVDLGDPDGTFLQAYGLPAAGAALMRPDGFVAWRAKSVPGDPEGAIAGALRSILCVS